MPLALGIRPMDVPAFADVAASIHEDKFFFLFEHIANFAGPQSVLEIALQHFRAARPRYKQIKPALLRALKNCAEAEGFEPPDGSHRLRFSRPTQSTTLPDLLFFIGTAQR